MPEPGEILEYLWERQEGYAEAVAALYAKQMDPAVKRIKSARTGFPDVMRAAHRKALRFGGQSNVERLSSQFLADSYAAGRLFIRERNRQLQGRKKLPKVEGAIRKADPGVLRAVAGFDFSLADKRALAKIEKSHLMWFTDETGATYLATDALDEAATSIIADGRSGSAIAERLGKEADKHYGLGTFAGKSARYWAGVAENASSTAAAFGQLHELQELGFTRYVLVNPMDERTSQVCQVMNGKSILVASGIKTMTASLAAKTPLEVKASKPFVSGGSPNAMNTAIGGTLKPGDKELSPAQSKALGKAGLAVPPFHHKCRTYVDVDPFG